MNKKISQPELEALWRRLEDKGGREPFRDRSKHASCGAAEMVVSCVHALDGEFYRLSTRCVGDDVELASCIPRRILKTGVIQDVTVETRLESQERSN